MTDTQLVYFTTIVELGSFSEASLELNISQSSISKQIMQLENELGVKLFDRSSRKVSLSKDGEYLYEDALAALTKINHLKESASNLASHAKKRISLLALPVIGHYNFYIPIQLFEAGNPDFEVLLEEMEEPEIYRRIRAGDYDAAITYYNPDHISGNARFYPLVEDEMLFVCSRSHPLSSMASITPDMVDDLPVMAMQKYTCVSHLYELYFRKHRSNPHIIFRGRPGTIMVGAQSNKAPALLTRVHTDTLRISNVSLIPFSPPLKGILGIIVNEQSTAGKAVEALVSELSAAD